jgi:hypothetical protein
LPDVQVKESYNESDWDPVGSNQPTKSDGIPGCGPSFGSLVLESDGILVSEFDGTLRRVLTDLYYELVVLTN